MDLHAQEVTDLLTLYAVDNLIGQCDRVAELLDDRPIKDLDVLDALRVARRKLYRFRNKSFD